MICLACGNKREFSGYWRTTLDCSGTVITDEKTGEILYGDSDFDVSNEESFDYVLDSCAQCGSSKISESDDLIEAIASMEGDR